MCPPWPRCATERELAVASHNPCTFALSLPLLVFDIGPSILIHHPFRRYRLVALKRITALRAAAMAVVALELAVAELVHHLPPLLCILG